MVVMTGENNPYQSPPGEAKPIGFVRNSASTPVRTDLWVLLRHQPRGGYRGPDLLDGATLD